MSPARTTVLVVGAGPVGLVLACELARREVPVRVIDKLPRATTESRAVVVHARTLEAFSRTGVVEEIVSAGQRTTGLEIYADGSSIGRFALDSIDSPYPFSVTLPQDDTERILSGRLAALGVAIERGRELISFDQDPSGVQARLSDGEEISCDWIAGTDGSHSTVRGALGSRLEGSFKGETFLLGDVEAEHDLDRSTMHSFFASDAGPLMVFPMLGRRLRLIGQLEGAAAATLEQLQAMIDHRTSGFRLDSARWITTFEIHHAQVPQYRVGRAFLAGDAAHVHSPAGGQGMNTGIQDAFNLGWKLAQAAQGDPDDALLDSYHAERHPVAAHVITITTATTDAGTVSNPFVRRLRNRALHVASGLSPIAHALAEETEETRVAYHNSPIVEHSHGARHTPQPGGAAPDVAAVNLHHTLARATGHTALYIAAPGQTPRPMSDNSIERHVLVADAPSASPEFNDTLADPDRTVAARYGTGRHGGIFVIRPDGYIARRAKITASAHH
jgi:2-polyprenyl-6-methoxyphenol hydroxylase-like FAD-dependent oxidoreductase